VVEELEKEMEKMLPNSGDHATPPPTLHSFLTLATGAHTSTTPNPNSGGLRRKGFGGGRAARRWGGIRAV